MIRTALIAHAMSTFVSISVVIAAHNEEDVLGRCLDALLQAARPDELEIVVVCNGCTDRTADVARAYGDGVRVIETPQASKTAALNLGDARVSGFPRFYVDADVTLPLASVRRIAARLAEGDASRVAGHGRRSARVQPWPSAPTTGSGRGCRMSARA